MRKLSEFKLSITFLHELLPPFSPFCELLSIDLLYPCPFMNTVHEIIAKSVAIINSFYCPLVISNLPRDKDLISVWKLWKQDKYLINRNTVN